MPDLLLTSAETASLRPLAEAVIRATGGWPAPDGTPIPDSLTPGRRREELLLARIKEEGGLWTGTRAAAVLYAHDFQCTPERAVQYMLRLRDRGELVVANPPRGRTFQLPAGPADPPKFEWTTRQRHPNGTEWINDPVSDGTAREWMRHPETGHVALMRRAVTFGPWIEVAADEVGEDA